MTTSAKNPGARPAGTRDEEQAARNVREMFSSIAPRYDLLNHLLSMNVDRLWWWRTARTFRGILQREDARVLDLCCGTGDMAFAMQKVRGIQPGIVGVDFAHPMLVRARNKTGGRPVQWLEADALNLPFQEESFDLVSSAFGFRNLANYYGGLLEIHRVLRNGGEVGILDFSEPRGAVGKVYSFYFKRLLPTIGAMISGDRSAYEYLPASVEKFPDPPQMLERMEQAGFRDVSWTPYTLGIAGLYRGKK
jgi:demethylmenaquinone methyltransferase/2-methoxy-6-polyprenyl-1,4-benzoquinol methylase